MVDMMGVMNYQGMSYEGMNYQGMDYSVMGMGSMDMGGMDYFKMYGGMVMDYSQYSGYNMQGMNYVVYSLFVKFLVIVCYVWIEYGLFVDMCVDMFCINLDDFGIGLCDLSKKGM